LNKSKLRDILQFAKEPWITQSTTAPNYYALKLPKILLTSALGPTKLQFWAC